MGVGLVVPAAGGPVAATTVGGVDDVGLGEPGPGADALTGRQEVRLWRAAASSATQGLG